MHRVVACLLGALVVAPVLADDEAPEAAVAHDEEALRDGWALDLPLDAPSITLPAREVPVGVALWLPRDEVEAEGGVLHGDALQPGTPPRTLSTRLCLLELSTPPLQGFAALALRWGAATLALPDGRVLQPVARALSLGWDVTAPMIATLFFAALPDSACELLLRVPGPGGADDESGLTVPLFRWRERLERAEAALATWRADFVASAARPDEAGGGSSGRAVVDLLGCGERVSVPLLLRELTRDPSEEPLPPAVVLPVLATTAWGRGEGLSPAPADGELAVARWRARGEPSAPGARPPAR